MEQNEIYRLHLKLTEFQNKLKKKIKKKGSKSDTKYQIKRYKDEVIDNYVLSMKGNSQEVTRLESLWLTRAELQLEKDAFEIRLCVDAQTDAVVLSTFQASDDSVEVIQCSELNAKTCVKKIKPQLSWKERAHIVAFHLHPFFGNKDFNKIRTIYSVPQDTMKKWLYREEYISKWLSFVRNMKVTDILNTIPEKFRNHFVKQLRIAEGISYYPKMNQLGLKVFENKAEIFNLFAA